MYSEYFWILLDHLQPQVAIGNPLSLSVRGSMNLRLKIQVEFFSQKRKVLADSKIGPFTGAAAIIGACLNVRKMYMFCGEMPHIANCRKGNTSTRYRQHVHPLDPPSDIFACTWISYRLACCPCVLLPSVFEHLDNPKYQPSNRLVWPLHILASAWHEVRTCSFRHSSRWCCVKTGQIAF